MFWVIRAWHNYFSLGWILNRWRLIIFISLFIGICLLFSCLQLHSSCFFFLNRFTLCFIFDSREIFKGWNYCKMYVYPSEIIHYDVSLLHYHLLCKHTCGLCWLWVSLVQFIETVALLSKMTRKLTTGLSPYSPEEHDGFICSLNPDLWTSPMLLTRLVPFPLTA